MEYPFLWMSLIPVPTIQTFMLSFLCRYDDNAASDRRKRPPEDREGWQINKPSYGARSSRKGRTSSFALAYHKKEKDTSDEKINHVIVKEENSAIKTEDNIQVKVENEKESIDKNTSEEIKENNDNDNNNENSVIIFSAQFLVKKLHP